MRASWWPVAAQGVAVVLAAVAAWLASQDPALPVAVVGYVSGAVVVVAFSAVYRALRDGRRGDGAFRPQPWLDNLARVLVLLGVAAGMANAFLLATELAK